jgi:putative phosphoribosyl transferase
MLFTDRHDAGRRLGQTLARFRDSNPLVIGLARGGVVVAAEVARALDAPLDVLVARKIGAPGHPEFGIGAIAPGATVLNTSVVNRLGIPDAYLDLAIARETREMERRESLYRQGRPLPPLQGKTVLLVDDGLATGATAQAALDSVRHLGPERLVFASPVCERDSAEALLAKADEVICLAYPRPFRAVGLAYEDFDPTSDAEVLECLAQSKDSQAAVAGMGGPV